MTAIPFSQVRKGMVIEDAGRLFAVHGHCRVAADWDALRLRLRDVHTGEQSARSVRADDHAEPASLETRPMQYIYPDGDGYVFVDVETLAQTSVRREWIADLMPYIKEGQKVMVVFHDGRPVSVEVPQTVALAVVDTDAPLANQRPAVLETGLRMWVPAHVSIGDRIEVDTRRGEYAGVPLSVTPGA